MKYEISQLKFFRFLLPIFTAVGGGGGAAEVKNYFNLFLIKTPVLKAYTVKKAREIRREPNTSYFCYD